MDMAKDASSTTVSLEVAGHTLKMDIFGVGERLLICLPGFGTERSIFHFLADHLPDQTCMAALDLPWLGESTAPDAFQAWTIEDWNSLWEKIMAHFPACTTITLLGFSLGARIALHFYAHSQQAIDQLVLVAADGLKLHPLYRFCVKTALGRFIFKKTMRHPGWILRVLRILSTLKLIGKAPYRFVRSQLEGAATRQMIERVWLGYASLRQDRKKMVAEAQAGQTAWHLIWGEQDQVIRPKFGKAFARQVPGTTLKLVKGGHFLLNRPSQELINTLKESMHQV